MPSGVSSVDITATGSAGQAPATDGKAGGTGDEVSGTLSGLSGQTLDVCVNYGGGAGANDDNGGDGGGASGVALGSGFSTPVLIAGGGGGGSDESLAGGTAGANAGLPDGGTAANSSPLQSSGHGGGGGGGTQTGVGSGGTNANGGYPVTGNGGNGSSGSPSSSAGPGGGGTGGAFSPDGYGYDGGGGGAGYYGGGGGSGAGGGGGSDFCAGSLPGASLGDTCGVAGHTSVYGAVSGGASVELTFSGSAQPSLALSAPSSSTAGSSISGSSIVATMSSATAEAYGAITFTVFGPQASAPTDCSSGGTTVGSATVSGNGPYSPGGSNSSSVSYTPTQAGDYYWYASYSGGGDDGNNGTNSAANSGCGASMQETIVKTVPSLSLSAPSSGSAGTAISTSSISATLSGATASATGTVTFTVFGPQASAPTNCSTGGTTVGTTSPVSGNGDYNPTSSYSPTQDGNYYWYASYSGDTNNSAANSGCGASMPVTSVTAALSLSAPPSGIVGTAISASSVTATLSGASSASGTVTFTVFGPQASPPTDCSTGGTTVGTTSPVSGNGSYNPSSSYTPTQAGSYYWYASYSGDANNTAVNSGCGASMPATPVLAPTSLSLSAPSSGTAGTAITASSVTATLSGATASATGAVTFTVFGPQASPPTDCSTGGTTVGTTSPVSGNGSYNPTSSYTPTQAGDYYWYASYSGDSENTTANSGCGASMQETVVGAASVGKSFSSGCSTFSVPYGVSSIGITATGSAGGSSGASGGTGDELSGTLSDLTYGQTLRVCVNQGGGSGNEGGYLGNYTYGAGGGGASGVALGSDFSTPVLIAAGGGGGGMTGGGGSAGPVNGGPGTGAYGGGGGTQDSDGGGAGGGGGNVSGGSPGSPTTSAGPGGGGNGGGGPTGGGGGGYYGGGGGGGGGQGDGGGGGGGSDFCAMSLTGASLSGCGVVGSNASAGTGSVELSYVPASIAPTITSGSSTTFQTGQAGTFTVESLGSPTASLSETGSLPSGVSFTDNGDGTATLAGTPASGTDGTYPITITASNGVSPDATQNFTLNVQAAPAITSDASTTFQTGQAGTFKVTSTGTPTPSLSETGSLPSGVTFSDNGDGTAALAGTPGSGTDGSYPITITAGNGISPDATQSFTLTVQAAPDITSGASTTFQTGQGGTFTVTSTGTPTPSVSETGALPSGVTFTDNGDGTARLDGTPASGSDGSYPITITASNSVSPDATQSFTLNVQAAPAITSDTSTIFAPGQAGTFTVTTTGTPTPSVSEAGSLPSGVAFSDNGDGTATLAGTPAAGSDGSYPITIKASNGVSPDATQSFTLAVDTAPDITSGASTTFQTGQAGTFKVTSTGSPTPALSEAGSLPDGVTFSDNGDGTATLAGTPSSGSDGSYPITITASNDASPDATQNFTLTVQAAPEITSDTSTTFATGHDNTFTVTTSGTPIPSVSESGSLPSGVTFTDNGDGTATLTGDPGSGTGGSYPITITASNSVSPDATQNFTLTVREAPAITSGTSTAFDLGQAGSFKVTSTGTPTPSLEKSGALPSGVTFTDNGDGTATLAGTPASGTAGTYPITITAGNGISPDAMQEFTLTVQDAPAFVSDADTTFETSYVGNFTVRTTGTPAPALSESGALPDGVTFTDNGDGTARLSGPPDEGSDGSYPIAITASNGVSPDATQNFTLTVDTAPAITSDTSTIFSPGQAGTFTVTSTGSSTPSLSETGALPSGVTFSDNGDGTATLAGTPSSGSDGSYPITITASNGISPDATQDFMLTVEAPPTATITTPEPNASYTLGQTVDSSFSCSGGSGGEAIDSCLDEHGHASGQPVDTSNPGTHSFIVTATNNDGLTGTASVTYTVSPATSTSLASSANPSTNGQQVTYTATVSPNPGGGSIAFADHGTTVAGCGAVALDTTSGAATCKVSYSSAGSHAIQATYSGDTSYSGSRSSSLTQVVKQPVGSAPKATSTRIVSSLNRAVTGQHITYTATITPASARGTVEFFDGGTPVARCHAISLNAVSGTATCHATYGRPGSHRIKAAYTGDADYTSSQSRVLTERVRSSVTLHGAPSVVGGGVRFTVRCARGSGRYTLTGTLTMPGRDGQLGTVGIKTVKLSAGSTKAISVALNHSGRQLLAAQGKLPVKLTLMLDIDGQTFKVASRRLTIHPR